MSLPEIKREILPGGDVRLSSGDCTFVYRRPRAGALLVTIWLRRRAIRDDDARRNSRGD
ncbi:MAG TPA: hypothetical protein VGB68_04700 [Pyrinomonadaceae bacterium]